MPSAVKYDCGSSCCRFTFSGVESKSTRAAPSALLFLAQKTFSGPRCESPPYCSTPFIGWLSAPSGSLPRSIGM